MKYFDEEVKHFKRGGVEGITLMGLSIDGLEAPTTSEETQIAGVSCAPCGMNGLEEVAFGATRMSKAHGKPAPKHAPSAPRRLPAHPTPGSAKRPPAPSSQAGSAHPPAIRTAPTNVPRQAVPPAPSVSSLPPAKEPILKNPNAYVQLAKDAGQSAQIHDDRARTLLATLMGIGVPPYTAALAAIGEAAKAQRARSIKSGITEALKHCANAVKAAKAGKAGQASAALKKMAGTMAKTRTAAKTPIKIPLPPAPPVVKAATPIATKPSASPPPKAVGPVPASQPTTSGQPTAKLVYGYEPRKVAATLFGVDGLDALGANIFSQAAGFVSNAASSAVSTVKNTVSSVVGGGSDARIPPEALVDPSCNARAATARLRGFDGLGADPAGAECVQVFRGNDTDAAVKAFIESMPKRPADGAVKYGADFVQNSYAASYVCPKVFAAQGKFAPGSACERWQQLGGKTPAAATGNDPNLTREKSLIRMAQAGATAPAQSAAASAAGAQPAKKPSGSSGSGMTKWIAMGGAAVVGAYLLKKKLA